MLIWGLGDRRKERGSCKICLVNFDIMDEKLNLIFSIKAVYFEFTKRVREVAILDKSELVYFFYPVLFKFAE
jgi:hypothetical protein